jgi:hypothetical protein
MHVKALGSSRKHPRRRPLLGPKANLRQNAFIASHKFAKKSSVRLPVNLPGKDFHAWNPTILDLWLSAIRSDKFASVHTSL